MKLKARSIVMDDETYDHLRALAKQKKTSISTMVRLITNQQVLGFDK